MDKLKIGFIGTGSKNKRPDGMGYAMAYQHATAYKALDNCELYHLDFQMRLFFICEAAKHSPIPLWISDFGFRISD